MKVLINRSFTVPVSVETAWHHLAKVEEWHTWAKHIKRIERESNTPLSANSKGKIYLKPGITSTFEMVEFNQYKNWKWVGPFLWLTVHYDHTFRRISDHETEMTFQVAADGLGESILGILFATIYNQNLNVAIPNLIGEYQSIVEIK